MNNFTILLTILLFSQMAQSQKNNDPYTTLWKSVEKLENEALTKSALKVVRSISEKAKKEKNPAQTVKALLYTSKYAMTLEEDAQLKIVNDFKSEIDKSEFPTKNILQSYLGNLYWQYFQQNRYRFYNRTKTTAKVDSTDFRTWDLTTLFEEISIHFEASLKNEKGLKETKTRLFDDILDKQPNSELYRPTLFDLLAHTALRFYRTSESNITRPADKFEIDGPEALCGAVQFAAMKIDNNDSTSLQVRALRVYQKLLQLHSSTKNLHAFTEVDTERLKYIYQNATFENKGQQYLEVLQNAAEASKNSSTSALYNYEIATLYQQQGNTYSPKTNEEHQWKPKEALEVCGSVIAKHPKSRGAEKCRALKSQILAKSLQLTTEQHIPINTTSRLQVDYKNHSALQLTAYRISQRGLKQLEKLYPQPKKLQFIKKLTIAKQWETELKNEKDHQLHSTEISMPPIENGQFVILATPKHNSNKTFAYSPVQVTNTALVETNTTTHHYFQVVDRRNGKPISGANVKFSYRQNHNRPKLSKTLVTDKMGTVTLPLTKDYWIDVNISIAHAGDKAVFNGFYIDDRYDQNRESITNSCFLFTDRSIYRPGQPLYFKGIAIKNNQGVSSVLENTTVTVELKDANHQVVGTQKFKTNDHGSFSGEFILPNNGLTGGFSLQVSSKQVVINGYANFSVEEYKRPKFETSFEPITETYKVNDSVTVEGKAIAYAGSNITGAKVTYRVKRVVYFPKWHYWHHPNFNTKPQEIAHGETKTDASGSYEIEFKALPDNSVDKKNLPTFNYEITADVTDINGETHSATTRVTVGYHAMTATIDIPDLLDKDEKEAKITVSTNNLNGQSVQAKGTLKMYKLKAPEYVLRPRTWPAPDYEGFSKAKFKELYPHDAYGDEDDPSNWKKGALVWESTFDTGNSTEILLKNTKKWLSGVYVIELESKDKFGQLVKDLVQTTLFGHTDKKLADNQLFEIKTDKKSYEIGDKVKVTLLSSAEDITVTVYVEKDQKIIDSRLIHLNNNSGSFTVPVDAADLGGFAITYVFSAFNSFVSGDMNISVPYPSSDLKIETLAFRDKLQPGTDETWSFKIKGPKGDKVAAELLAGMYDASLDAFRGHNWGFDPLTKPTYYSHRYTNAHQSFGINPFNTYKADHDSYSNKTQHFDSFDRFGLYFGHGGRLQMSGKRSQIKNSAPEIAMEVEADGAFLGKVVRKEKKLTGSAAGVQATDLPLAGDKEKPSFSNIKIRKNLQETAFFFPQLMTDKEGSVSFSFTTPEALTKWKLQLLAHTKNLESSVTTLEAMTQKELMVMPNAPRFLREGDEIVISSKIANLTDKRLSGQAKLELIDAVTGKDVAKKLLIPPPSGDGGAAGGGGQVEAGRNFKVDSLGNTQVSWTLKIPENIQAVQYKIIAKAGDFSDGEQNVLPVLTNRMLVTETLPMWVRSNQTKTFTLNKLKNVSSTTLKHHKLTLEMTSNPAWYAVQALPYLMEYPYECNEQTFSKYYANTLASHIANSNPRIQDVFDQWANSDALVSNLEKNQELKSLLIQETPWLRDAQSETEQKKRIALLFDLNKMKSEQAIALNTLKQNQKPSGAWAWFNGGSDNRFITQHIITGLGHLNKLTAPSSATSVSERSRSEHENQKTMIRNAISYLDREFVNEYNRMKKYASNLKDDHLSQTQIHYLYMRSFFTDVKKSKKVNEITLYYKGQAQKYWMNRSLYSKGMLALILNRMDDSTTSNKIIRSLEENSVVSEELGMYWKENTNSWYWYQAPIETQALLIEAFSEIQNDTKTIDNLKIWLLKNKQTNQWKTTKATTDAVYALLLQGSDWLSVTEAVEVLVGGEKIDVSKLENVKTEAGTGYYKTSWNANAVKPKMGEVQISKKGEGIAWGALYWQYFEDLDKITSAETPLKLKKKLFLKKNTDTGEEISGITSKTTLKVGDLIRVRIELRVDRPMEFVHMKDMRASGLEPVNVISRYKWQDGLGYYESTKDASTNFFFDHLPKGAYVFEYDLRVNNAGNFSNGITTIQSMYAPEFSSHSEGTKVAIEGK